VTNLQPDHEDFLRGFSDIGKLFVQRDKWTHDGHAAIALLNTAHPRLLTLVINLGENQREVSAKHLPNIRMLKLY
jgi:hypothetical protein